MKTRLAKGVVAATGALAAALIVFVPRPTEAEEISEQERSGEYDEGGQKFGNVVVSAKLVADPASPGGWALVRTLENKSDAREECTLEERVLRTKTMHGARVEPPPTAMLVRRQKFALAPHQKQTIGIYLPPTLGAEIGAAAKREAAIEAAIARAYQSENPNPSVFAQTYHTYHVDYLTPLPPNATAAKVDNGVNEPAAMPIAPPPPQVALHGTK